MWHLGYDILCTLLSHAKRQKEKKQKVNQKAVQFPS